MNMETPSTWELMLSRHAKNEARIISSRFIEKYSKKFEQRILTNDLLYDLLFSYCSPATFIRLSQTCFAAYAAVHSYMGRSMNINRIFSRFFSDILGFRQLQARTGTLVSGSAALQFFDRSFYPDSDLDIYVPIEYRKDVGQFLFEEGYEFVPNSKQDEDFWDAVNHRRVLDTTGIYAFRGVSAVFTFQKDTLGEELKVQLIVAVNCPMEIILGFHSTCVMNVISFEKAYSLYPKATFEERRSLVCASDGPKQEPAMEKYAQRGWKMVTDTRVSDLETSFHYHQKVIRWIGDSHCWTIQLDVSDIPDKLRPDGASPRLFHDPVSASSWKLGYDNFFGGTMEFALTDDDALYLRYVYASEDSLRMLETIKTKFEPLEELRGKAYYDMAYVSMCMLHFRFFSDVQAVVSAMANAFNDF